jgi:hypothetical protein
MKVQTRIYDTPKPSIGIVIGTFAAIPYVHLHLEMWQRFYSDVPVLVSDDGSPFAENIAGVCGRYGVSFVTGKQRHRRTIGDLSAFVRGFAWAEGKNIDILVKMSRRFIPCANWVPQLQELADISQMPTFSQCCNHFRFGFRTECIALHCGSWATSGALLAMQDRVEVGAPIFVEGFIHQLARRVASEHACAVAREYMARHPRAKDRDGYAEWPIMPDRRTTKPPLAFWHDCDIPEDYARAARLVGLGYIADDFKDPNQGCGLGER